MNKKLIKEFDKLYYKKKLEIAEWKYRIIEKFILNALASQRNEIIEKIEDALIFAESSADTDPLGIFRDDFDAIKKKSLT